MIYLLLVSLLFDVNCLLNEIKPHIVLIIADDLGWGDVGFTDKHNTSWSGAETPNLSNLAAESLMLDNLYSQAMCTPTRASLLTGKYPHRLGWLFASTVILTKEEKLDSRHRLFTEDLSEDLGYKVHGVGKWHLGSNYPNTPLGRGFDSFYGCYSGGFDHLTHEAQIMEINEDSTADWLHVPDFHDDKRGVPSRDISDEVRGKHSTDLFTEEAVRKISKHDEQSPMFLYLSYTAPHSPLEPMEHIVQTRNSHISDIAHRQYAAMVTQLDDGIGKIIKTLKEKKMWSNTVFMFMSDNGASVINSNCWDTVGGSNAPFRDGKATFFEGGIKSAAFVWTPWLSPRQRGHHSPALLHAVDIHSFVLAAARDNMSDRVYLKDEVTSKEEMTSSDSGNHMINVVRGDDTGRETILHTLVTGPLPKERIFEYCAGFFPYAENYAVIRYKNFKLFYGSGIGSICESNFLVKSCSDILSKSSQGAMMLFDLTADPFERVNVATLYPNIVKHMIHLIKIHESEAFNAWM